MHVAKEEKSFTEHAKKPSNLVPIDNIINLDNNETSRSHPDIKQNHRDNSEQRFLHPTNA